MVARLGIIYGPQCSGKTTFAKNVMQGSSCISLGEVVRSTSLGDKRRIKAEHLIAQAKEWPSYLGLDFISPKILEMHRLPEEHTVFLDGYPRTARELKKLVVFLQNNNLPQPSIIIEFTANREELIDRYMIRKRGESWQFFELRYRQYEEINRVFRNLAISNPGISYYKIDTSTQ